MQTNPDPKPQLLTAWWPTTVDTWVHISELLRDPKRRLLLPLLDQLALELELNGADNGDR